MQENSASAFFIPLNAQSTIPQQTVFFSNVNVQSNPVPNKPFQVSVDIQSVNRDQLVVSISVPSQVSVTSPVVAKLVNTMTGNMRATWTLVTSQSGTYPITINAISNYPVDSEQFNLDVAVGYSKSLVVTDLNVPGSINTNSVFAVNLSLKNVLSIPDSNIRAQISAPRGIAILSNPISNVGSLDPSHEAHFQWNLKAEDYGAYVININYTSALGSSNVVPVNVNVGKFGFADVGTQQVALNNIPTMMAFAAPGDKLLTLDAKMLNTGTVPIYNMTVKLISGDILNVESPQTGNGTSGNSVNAVNNHPDIFQIGFLDVGQSADATYYVNISNQTALGTYISQLSVTYSDGSKLYNKVLTFPILISDTGIKVNFVTLKGAASFPGDVADQIDVKLINTGSYVSNVYTTLKLPNGLTPAWGNSTSSYFAQINPLQSVNASYFINISEDMSPTHYPLALDIKTQKGETQLPIDFVVSPKSVFTIDSIDSSQLFPGASNVPLSITFVNNSTIPANFVTTKLLTGNLIPGVKSSTLTAIGNEENIGTILPGQVFTTTFLVSMDPSGKSGDQSASVEIDWTQTNSNMQFTKSVPILFHVPEGASYLLYSGGIPWLYVIIALAFIAIVFLFIKKRRKRLETINLAVTQDRDMRVGGIFGTSDIEPLNDLSQEISDDVDQKTNENTLPKDFKKSIGKD